MSRRSSPHSCMSGMLNHNNNNHQPQQRSSATTAASASTPPTTTIDSEHMCESPDTPKTHNKRRSVSVVSATSANSSSSSSSSRRNPFSCESLQRSLKRVRLTSSPGELRLQRDLRAAVLHHHWIPVQEDEWTVTYVCNNNSHSNNTHFFHNFSNNNNTDSNATAVPVTVYRVGSMELVLHIPLMAEAAASNATTSCAISLTLQFPLLYPHRPPTVRVAVPRQANNNNSSSSSSSSSVHANNSSQWRIIIPANPDEAAALRHSAKASPTNTNTILWEEWSPIHRLSDICTWLVETCIQHARSHHYFLATTTTTTTTTADTVSITAPFLMTSPARLVTLSDMMGDHQQQQHEAEEEKKEDGPPSMPVDDGGGGGCDDDNNDGSPVAWRATSPLDHPHRNFWSGAAAVECSMEEDD